jgi:hypothetical protein
MTDALKKIVEANPDIDQQVVEDFEKAKELLADIRGINENGSAYSLDLPFGKNQVLQPTLSHIAKRTSKNQN